MDIFQQCDWHFYFTSHNDIDYYVEGDLPTKSFYKEATDIFTQMGFTDQEIVFIFDYAWAWAIHYTIVKRPLSNSPSFMDQVAKNKSYTKDAKMLSYLMIKNAENDCRSLYTQKWLEKYENNSIDDTNKDVVKCLQDIIDENSSQFNLTPQPDMDWISKVESYDWNKLTKGYTYDIITQLIEVMPYKEQKLQMLDIIDKAHASSERTLRNNKYTNLPF